MTKDSTKPLSKVIRIDESDIQQHLGKLVRGSVASAAMLVVNFQAMM